MADEAPAAMSRTIAAALAPPDKDGGPGILLNT